MNEQSRINAMIAYFFLGPLFLIAPRDTPLGTDFVRQHARRASIIIAIGIASVFGYIFFLSDFFQFYISIISVHTIILGGIMSILIGLLLQGAYRAYHGTEAKDIKNNLLFQTHIETEEFTGNYSEEEKIRILASFLPFVGIFIAERYNIEPYKTGSKIGGYIGFILITLVVIFGTTSSIVFLGTIVSIFLCIITGVYLFAYNRFLGFGVYQKIPGYIQIETHIITSFSMVFEFFRVAFGGNQRITYSTQYQEILQRNSLITEQRESYIFPNWIIGVPLINLITIPSFWQNKAREYRLLIAQGVSITIILIAIIWIYGSHSALGLYLLFPIIHLLANNNKNTTLRIFGVSPIASLVSLFSRGQEQLHTLGEKKEEVIFTYEEK